MDKSRELRVMARAVARAVQDRITESLPAHVARAMQQEASALEKQYQQRIEEIRKHIVSTLPKPAAEADLVKRFETKAMEFVKQEIEAMRESIVAEILGAIRALPAPEVRVSAPIVKNEITVPMSRRTLRNADGRVIGVIDEEAPA